MHPGHRTDGIFTTFQVAAETVFLINAVFFIYAKTSIGFMLTPYINSEVFTVNYMQ